jgi:PPE-repeat protein
MDFAAMPPEVNSARIYSGPGSAPMLAAAAAWDSLAAELHLTAAAYSYEAAGLTGGSWLGPAAMSMAAAVTAHVEWLLRSATQAQETADQAKAAAGAYEAAFLSTVPALMISENRSRLMALIATNIFGQNGSAIATSEAQYAEMWAQDAAAMYAYAGASAGATTLTPFTAPPSITDSGGLAGQAAAVAHAGTSDAAGTATALSKLVSAIPSALRNLASPLQSTSAATLPAGIAGVLKDLGLTSPVTFLNPLNTGVSVSSFGESLGVGLGSQPNTSLLAAAQQLGDGEMQILQRLDQLGPSAAAGSGAAMASTGSGRAATVGGLSVPQGWVARAPAVRLTSLMSPAAVLGTADAVADGRANLLSSLGLAAAMTAARPVDRAGPRGGQRVFAPSAAGSAALPTTPGGPSTAIASELYQLAGLRELGILTDGEFNRQKRRLLGE